MIGGIILVFSTRNALGYTDWSQPPLDCIENAIAQAPRIACLDLTQVKDPLRDFPQNLTEETIKSWKTLFKRDLLICRSQEILRRESLNSGSMDPISVEVAWMRTQGILNTESKVDSIYQASAQYELPPQILLGALMQESMMADLGIAADGNNYSCGIAQLNVLEWCHWMESLSLDKQLQLGWPSSLISEWKTHHSQAFCSSPTLDPTYVLPFYKIALTRLKGLPSYKLQPKHFENISQNDIEHSLPDADFKTQSLRHQIIEHFTQNCSTHTLAIHAKAFELKMLFKSYVPKTLQNAQQYKSMGQWNKACRYPYPTLAYPAHTGWLLADAIYNAGSRVVGTLTHYLKLTPQSVTQSETWEEFSPQQLIDALYWGGRYNSKSNLIEFFNLEGQLLSMSWYKSCVVQRHIARVIQYVTEPNAQGVDLVKSLEGKEGCTKVIPEARKYSSGTLSSFN